MWTNSCVTPAADQWGGGVLPRWRWRRRRRWWLPGQRRLAPSAGCPQAWSPATGWQENRIPQTTWRTRTLEKQAWKCQKIAPLTFHINILTSNLHIFVENKHLKLKLKLLKENVISCNNSQPHWLFIKGTRMKILQKKSSLPHYTIFFISQWSFSSTTSSVAKHNNHQIWEGNVFMVKTTHVFIVPVVNCQGSGVTCLCYESSIQTKLDVVFTDCWVFHMCKCIK